MNGKKRLVFVFNGKIDVFEFFLVVEGAIVEVAVNRQSSVGVGVGKWTIVEWAIVEKAIVEQAIVEQAIVK